MREPRSFIFARMKRPCLSSTIAAIKACTELPPSKLNVNRKADFIERGFRVHHEALITESDQDICVASSLVNMYSRLGSIFDARLVFDKMQYHDAVVWNALLMGYAENGEGLLCLELLTQMNCKPNERTFLAALKACSSIGSNDKDKPTLSLARGMEVHVEAIKRGFNLDIFVVNTLIDMYSKCGSLFDARKVFDKAESHNVVSWTALIMACCDNKEEELALSLFYCMLRSSGCQPNAQSFVVALNTCCSLAARGNGKLGAWKDVALENGKEIFYLAERCGFTSDAYMVRSMVNVYVKGGNLVEARRLSDQSGLKDVVCWTSLMLGYVESGELDTALDIFESQRSGGCVPDARAFVAALKICSGLAERERELPQADGKSRALDKGLEIVSYASALGYDSDLYVACSTITMFSKCGKLSDSQRVFNRIQHKDTAMYTSLMMGYVENGDAESALQLFERMISEKSVQPNGLTFVAVMSSVASLAEREEGQETETGTLLKPVSLDKGINIYSRVTKLGLLKDAYIISAAVDMFFKCGSVDHARKAYENLEIQNLVSLNALIVGYVENGEADQALELFFRAKESLTVLDSRTYAAAMKACGILAATEAGRAVYGEFCRSGLELRSITGNSSVDFFAKCGRIDEAQLVFDSMTAKDSVSWTCIIAGYSRQGNSKLVFKLMEEMVEGGVKPDGVTMVAVLTVCSHAGLIEKGKACFKAMGCRFGLIPEIEHYVCMVDMLGRANMVKEALEMVNEMPHKANAVTLKCVLGACKKWRDVEVGRTVFEAFLKLNSGRLRSGFGLMRSLYANLGVST